MKKLILPLLFFLSSVFFSSDPSADSACGDGYVCWPTNGGSAAVISSCEDRGSADCYTQSTYNQYCICAGSSNCSCTLGPGTQCSWAQGSPGESFCACAGGPYEGTLCQATGGPGCTNHGAYPDAIFHCNPPTTGRCYPTGTSTIGCCYGSDVTPTPNPTPTPTDGSNPPTPTPTGTLTPTPTPA